MTDDQKGPKPLESFFPLLCMNRKVIDELKDSFGERAISIINNIKSGSILNDDELLAFDIISDLVNNDPIEDKEYSGLGGLDAFPITIKHFGPVYFVEALDFDTIGYFSNFDDADSYAFQHYGEYMASYDQEEQAEEDNNNEEE